MKDIFNRCVIVDLDGTIANIEHRLHLIKVEKNWPAFFDACTKDRPNDYVVQLVDELYPHYEIVICSGRPETHRNQTIAWLNQHQVWHDHLFMRKEKDYRPDTVVKKEFLDIIKDLGYKPWISIDDRPEVVQMWRDNGVPCLAVPADNWVKGGPHG